MNEKNYSATFSVDRSPEEVFAAINNVRKWWSGDIEGVTDRVGSEFVYRYKDMHRSTQKITELVPGKRIVWHVTDAYLSFVENKREWKGTDIVFDIRPKDGKTVVEFTHIGLVPTCDCYRDCSGGWKTFVSGSLRKYIETGKAQPDPFAASA